MRPIDADALNSIKFHPLPYTHITPSDADAESYKRGWNDVIDAIIESASTIEPERKKGEWILSDDRYWKTCSECGVYVDASMGLGIYDVNNNEVSEMRFCPNCGADMRGDQNG